jgi:hypothetical protein
VLDHDAGVGHRPPRARRAVGTSQPPGAERAVSRVCRFVVIVFAALYAAAFALFLVGTYGWLGSPRGPLAGVFLVPLGLPWVLWLDGLPPGWIPPAGIAAPALNLLLLWGLCRRRSRR